MKQQFWRSSVICTLLLCLAAGFNSCKKEIDDPDDDGNSVFSVGRLQFGV